MDGRSLEGWVSRRARRISVALVVCLVAASAGTGPVAGTEPPAAAPRMPLHAELERAARTAISDVPRGGDLPDLDALSDYAWSIAESMPPERWDVEALAEALRYDPMAAFTFVRDHIRYEPYAGVLRGAEGTLAARAGNAYDRSLLLAALLDLMLVDHSFVTARLDDAGLDAVMGAARAGAPVPLDPRPPGARLDVEAIGLRARRDFARLAQALGPDLPGAGGTDEALAIEDARDHVWLRIPFGAELLDLDTTLPDAEPGDVLAPGASASAELPDGHRHAVELRLIVESLQGGVLSEQVVLEERLDAVEASGRRVFLYFQPDLSGLGGAILDVLSGDERWVPVLLVDDEGVAGQPFSAGGRTTDLLGDPTTAPDLVSLRLVAATVSPGRPIEEATHVLYDRRPPGPEHGMPGSPVDEADLEPLLKEGGAPLPLAGIYHVMVSTGGASPRTYAFRQAQMADFIHDALLDEAVASEYSFADRLWPLAVADQSLVINSEQVMVPAAGGPDAHGYVARPRVYLASIAPDPADVAVVTLTTDLMLDGVRILPRTPGAPTAPLQVWYGVLQSALETELGLRRAAAVSDGPPQAVASASMAIDEALEVLGPAAGGGLPSGAHPALAADLAAGRIVAAAGPAESAASWWSVDPASGVTRAMVSPGIRGYRDTTDRPGRGIGRVADTSRAKWLYDGPKHPPPGDGPPRGFRPGPYRPVGPAPVGCGPNEYSIIVRCVSLPTAIVFWGFGAILGSVLFYYANSLYQDWLCEPPATFCTRD